MMRGLKIIGVVGAMFVVASAAQAAVSSPLGMGVAATAAAAEKGPKPAAIRPAVRDAVKQLIVNQGPKPDDVIVAIDAVFTACRPSDGSKPLEGWSCPSTEQAYAALLEVRGVVLALLESPEPGAIGDGGPAAFSNFPVTNAGGSNYTDLTDN